MASLLGARTLVAPGLTTSKKLLGDQQIRARLAQLTQLNIEPRLDPADRNPVETTGEVDISMASNLASRRSTVDL